MIIYSDKLLPKSRGGMTLGTNIIIRPSLKGDKILLKHEQVHVAQFKRDWLFPIKYLLSKNYRFNAELEAYRDSFRLGWPLAYCATALTHYGTGISTEDAKERLLHG